MEMNKQEMALFLEVAMNEKNTDVRLERTASKFTVHYRCFGGIASRSIVYSLAGSMMEAAADIRRLEKQIA